MKNVKGLIIVPDDGFLAYKKQERLKNEVQQD